MEIVNSKVGYYRNKVLEELKDLENKNSYDLKTLCSILDDMELDIDVILRANPKFIYSFLFILDL